MATPQDFLERVVAWPGPDGPGYVNLHWLKAGRTTGMGGRPFKTCAEFMSLAQWCANKPTQGDIYFCLSTQSAHGRVFAGRPVAARSAHTVLHLKAIWLDIDVKPEKGYGSVSLALDALNGFIASSGLPSPSAIILSGGGIHTYWISDTPLTKDEWLPYAYGLRNEAEKYGLKFDAGVTTDPARVLRVPGTYNYKTTPPRPCTVAALGESYSFASEFGFLVANGRQSVPQISSGPENTAAVTVAPGFEQPAAAGFGPVTDDVSDGLNVRDDRPLDIAGVLRGCEHFAALAASNGKGVSQGLWMQDMLATTFLEDGRKYAHFFSKGYATYSHAETEKMYDRKLQDKADRGLGWPSCQAFENEGAKECGGCPFRGKIRSPLNLAERVHTPAPVSPVIPAAASNRGLLPGEGLTNEHLPDGYCLDERGRIGYIVERKLANGVTTPGFEPLFMSILKHAEAIGGAGKDRGLRFEVLLDGGTWGKCFVPEVALCSLQDTLMALRSNGVKPYVPNQAGIIQFMTSFMDKVDQEQKRLTAVPFGWVTEGAKKVGFAYGGHVMRKDGKTSGAGMIDPQLGAAFAPCGEITPWFQALKVITDQHYPALEAIVAMSFAAPLMWVTGQYNGVLCAWSKKGGTHKSTSVAVGLAVWGNPQMAKENKASSINGMIGKLAHLQNLPIYWDEINRPELMKPVVGFLDIATEGQGGTKMFQDRTLRPKEHWQTLVGIGANTSLWEFIMRTNKNTDAQLQRVFEIEVEKRPDSEDPLAVQRLIASLNDNYGQMGLLYGGYLARDPEAIDKYVKAIHDEFNKSVGMQSEERFRAALASTTLAGAALANVLGASFNILELHDYLKAEFLKQRTRIGQMADVGTSEDQASEVLAHFFQAIAGNVLWTDSFPAGRGKPKPCQQFGSPRQGEAVLVRCSVDDRRIMISKGTFTRFMQENDHAPMSTFDSLRKFYGMAEYRADLTSGTPYMGTRETVIALPVSPGGQLEEVLNKHTPASRPAAAVPTGIAAPVTAAVTEELPPPADSGLPIPDEPQAPE